MLFNNTYFSILSENTSVLAKKAMCKALNAMFFQFCIHLYLQLLCLLCCDDGEVSVVSLFREDIACQAPL